MEDKILDLMAKMYEDLSSKLDSIEKKIDNKADKADVLKLEFKLEENSKALFDGYKQVYEKLTVIEDKVANW